MTNVRSITPLPPANFTPEMGNFKTLKPFRYWCQKVLPLVYDDSLSYYELLCKVIDYLNKTMEDVETLHGDITDLHKAYTQLQEYVNNYFSTLDMQEEINKKLDEMASNGELANLMGKYMIRNYDTFDDVPKNIIGINYHINGRNYIGDGGDSVWYTSNTKPDKLYYEEFDGVYHILLQSPANIVSVGCVDANNNIDTDKLSKIKISGGIFIPNGIYKASNTIKILSSLTGNPISLPNINHARGEVDNWRADTNAVIDSTADTILSIGDGCSASNLVIRGHSYYQTEHRELVRQGNEQPVYSRYESGTQIGIHCTDYGAIINGCAVYFCHTGIKTEYYSNIDKTYSFECKIGLYVNINDNNVTNHRSYDCETGVFISGTLNTISNVRCDGISGVGFSIGSHGNTLTNIAVDFSYLCGIKITGRNNIINNARLRCCAKYPNTDTELNEENVMGNCGILINGNGNYLKGIPLNRPSILDSGEAVRTMNKIVVLEGGSYFTNVEFCKGRPSENYADDEDSITCLSGNAPATSFKTNKNYYSSSFTNLKSTSVLTIDGVCNTKQTDATKGNMYLENGKWYICNGTSWDEIS